MPAAISARGEQKIGGAKNAQSSDRWQDVGVLRVLGEHAMRQTVHYALSLGPDAATCWLACSDDR